MASGQSSEAFFGQIWQPVRENTIRPMRRAHRGPSAASSAFDKQMCVSAIGFRKSGSQSQTDPPIFWIRSIAYGPAYAALGFLSSTLPAEFRAESSHTISFVGVSDNRPDKRVFPVVHPRRRQFHGENLHWRNQSRIARDGSILRQRNTACQIPANVIFTA